VKRGEIAEKVGQLGWSLSIEKDVNGLIGQLSLASNEHTVLVFHCMDNGSFFSMNKTGGSSLPRKDKKDKRYHIEGKLVVANGYSLELMTDQIGKIVNKVKPGLAVIVTPMPRYLDPCCDVHKGDKTEDQLKQEREKLIKAIWSLKREIFQLVTKSHLKNTVVVGHLEVVVVVPYPHPEWILSPPRVEKMMECCYEMRVGKKIIGTVELKILNVVLVVSVSYRNEKPKLCLTSIKN
jgi:hypothetical protein